MDARLKFHPFNTGRNKLFLLLLLIIETEANVLINQCRNANKCKRHALPTNMPPKLTSCSTNITLTNLVIHAVGAVIIATLVITIHRALHRLYDYYGSIRVPRLNPEVLVGYPTVHLMLEIRSGTERAVIPMAIINGFVHEITLIGHLRTRILGYRGTFCGGTLALNFDSDRIAKLQIGTLTHNLPDTVHIPWYMVFKIRRLSQSRYATRVLRVDEYGLTHKLLEDELLETYPPNDSQRLL